MFIKWTRLKYIVNNVLQGRLVWQRQRNNSEMSLKIQNKEEQKN